MTTTRVSAQEAWDLAVKLEWALSKERALSSELAKALEVCISQIEGAYSSSLEDNEPVWLKNARAVLARRK